MSKQNNMTADERYCYDCRLNLEGKMNKEYIDKHEAYLLLKHKSDTYMFPETKYAYKKAAILIDSMKTHEVQPVKHGRWIENSDPGQNINEHYMCSVCGSTFHNWANDNYCSNCGARMDGESE